MERGIFFGDYHTADDWDLILNSKRINPPTPKIVKITVDGRDGDLDLSEALTGEITYNNREASFTFLVTEGTYEEREELIGNIINIIHGKRCNIIEPDDLDHYLIGRCSVSEVYNTLAYGSFVVSADCEPYRYRTIETVREFQLTDTAVDIALTNNGRKRVIPTITVTDTVSIVFGTVSASLDAGTYLLPNLVLKSGQNIFSIRGSGTVTFTYREAVL